MAVALLTVTLLAGCTASFSNTGTRLRVPTLPSLAGISAGGVAADLPPVANTRPRTDLPRYRAAKAGPLPTGGTTSLAGVPIPAGAAVASTGASPTLWISTAEVPEVGQLVLKLIGVYSRTGLWPVVIDTTEPGLDHDFDPSQASSADVDPKVAFGQWWQENMGTGPGGDLDTFASADLGTTFPGLQNPPDKPIDALDGELVKLRGKLGLVSVTRPADIALATGWLGPTNYLDPGQVTVALRSWEDRYAVEPIELGFDFLVMAMANPPMNAISVLDLTAEQMAVCPDQIEQGNFDTPVEYANSLTGSPRLDCWWD